jgi:2,3-bisphosphoglycerate-independent phosphoglycerate mutase
MRRTVILVPELASTPDGDSVLRQTLPALAKMVEAAKVFKIHPVSQLGTPEAQYLGMNEGEADMPQGPLTVAALGADPPTPSVHFHLSLLSLSDGQVRNITHFPSADEERQIWDILQQLNTRTLTLLRGEGVDHALVWEGRGEFETHAPVADGLNLREHLPQGDAELPLRRMIDDSVNLLQDLELNQRRLDEGLAPINIAWPWGHGPRVAVPNLAILRGEPVVVESASMRLQGLSRLAGYRHEDRHRVGSGLETKFGAIASRCLGREASIVLIEGVEQLRESLQLEPLEWMARELDRALLTPLLEDVRRNQSQITLLAPGRHTGIGLTTSGPTERPLPFDERILEEPNVPSKTLSEAVRQGL